MKYRKSLISSMISFLSLFSGHSGAITHTISEAVIGHAPSINTHTYNNSSPQAGDALTINVGASDSDGDNISLEYQWLVDGNNINGATQASYTIRPGDIGHKIAVKVKVLTDPLVTIPDSAEQTFTDITLDIPAGSAPVAANAVITGSPNVGKTLTATYDFKDADNDQEGVSTFIWYRDGTPISGQTGNTYILTSLDKGKSIRFSITPVSATGTPNTGSMITSPDISNITDALVSCSSPINSIINNYLAKYPDIPDYVKNMILAKANIKDMNFYVNGNSYWSNTVGKLVYLSTVSCE